MVIVDTAYPLDKKVDKTTASCPGPNRATRCDDGGDSEFFRLPNVTCIGWFHIGDGMCEDLVPDAPVDSVGAGDNAIDAALENANPDTKQALIALKHAMKLKEKNVDRAEKMFEQALNLSPKNPVVLLFCGEFLESIGKVEDAYTFYRKSVLSAENPDEFPAKRKLTAILPCVNQLELEILRNAEFSVSLFKCLEFIRNGTEPNINGTVLENLNVKHIHHPCPGTSITEFVETGIKNAISYVKETLVKKESITVEDIKGIHRALMEHVLPDAAGRFREIQVYVGHHKPPPACDVERLMEEFVTTLEDPRTRKKHPLHIAAFAHFKLVDIHPFEDGNGRTARVLTNLILLKHGFPPIPMKTEVWNEYGKHLKTAHEGDIRPFLRFTALTLVLPTVMLMFVLVLVIFLVCYKYFSEGNNIMSNYLIDNDRISYETF